MGAHPRSRGENVVAVISASGVAGSSPLTRGKRTNYINATTKRGLIPAHAGKTKTARKVPDSWGAHPRSRGENTRFVEPSDATLGSSPLTRGKLGRSVPGTVLVGLIPAHAGKTCVFVDVSSVGWAHPRSRGENDRPSIQRAMREGSSPLTRGKQP